MKRKTDNKRGFRYYFMQTFAIVFTFAFLIGFIVYYGVLKYELSTLESNSSTETNYIVYDALEDIDDSEITENSMKMILIKTGNHDHSYTDYCTVVYDTENDKFYDSSNVIYCVATASDDKYFKPIKELSNDYFNNNYVF